MTSLCFVTTCMGRLSALKQSLGAMLEQPGGSCVVVDYSCPDHAGEWVEANHPDVRVVRVGGQHQFNAAAARNAGSQHADADWLCFVDSDVVLAPGFTSAVMPLLAPGGYYRAFSADRGLGGTFVCHRADLLKVGGFDEVYSCWGEEDNDLYDAFDFAGLKARALPADLLTHLAHDDLERTRHYPIADLSLGHAINRVYRILKWDTARARRELLSLEMRRELYERAAKVVTESFCAAAPGRLTVQLPFGIVPGGWSLDRKLTYVLSKDE